MSCLHVTVARHGTRSLGLEEASGKPQKRSGCGSAPGAGPETATANPSKNY